MIKYFFLFIVAVFFSSSNSSAQILDSMSMKINKKDTVIQITQQDVNEYIMLRKITDTIGKLPTYIKILKTAKANSFYIPKSTFENNLIFAEQNAKFQNVLKDTITSAEVSAYLSLRKITDDTTGKTKDFIKIIKSAKVRMAMPKVDGGLAKAIDFETALKDAEENFRIRNLVNKILVIKKERKMYLLKDGKTVKTFSVALGPNPVGQKEFEGDGKTPEGSYTLDWQRHDTPVFHSYHISYPNKADSVRANSKGLKPGSNIMIHGYSKGVKKKKDWTNGCIALTNADMIEFRKIVFQDTAIEIRK